MGVQHVGRHLRELARRGFALACGIGLGLIPTFGAQAAVVQGTITGFVPNPFGGGGNYVRTSDVRFTLQRAITAYSASTLGRTVVGEAALTLAPTAGRVIATACFANPALCAGAAFAAYFALSRIFEDDGVYKKEQEDYGACYTTRNGLDGGTGDMNCHTSVNAAVNEHVGVLNNTDAHDSETPSYTIEREYTGVLSPTCTPALNSSCQVRYTWVQTQTFKSDGHTVVTNSGSSGEEETLYRRPDQVSLTTVPATEGDMASHGTTHPPSDDVVNDYGAQGGAVPTLSPDFSKGVVPAGDPYPGDSTPNQGPWKQDRITTTGKPGTTDPVDLDTGTDTVDVDNPNTPDEDEGDGTDPNDPDAPTDPQEQFDLCKEHPNISACQELGEAPNDEVPKDTIDVEFEAEELGLPSTCPAPISMGGYGSLTFDTACDIATKISPLVVALGALAALMIMHAAIRRA